MATIRRILAATDLSDCSTAAVTHAQRIAHRFHAEVILLHAAAAVPASAGAPGATHGALAHSLARQEEEAAAALGEYYALHLSEFPPAHRTIASGDPAAAILRAADEFDVDMIVTGTHGRRGVERAVLGSVAEQVVHRSTRPVLTIRPDAAVRGSELRRILCPVNYTAVARNAYDHALLLACAFEAELFAVYLLEDGEKGEDRIELEAERLRDWIGDVPRPVRLTMLVDRGEAANQAIWFAKRHEIDLMVVGARANVLLSRTVLGSTTGMLMRRSPCAVLTVPATARLASGEQPPAA